VTRGNKKQGEKTVSQEKGVRQKRGTKGEGERDNENRVGRGRWKERGVGRRRV